MAPVFLAMPKMIKELGSNPASETGFLGHNGVGMMMVQYWRSFEHLERYARAHEQQHWPAWVAFNKRVAASRGDVGIWHETFLVKAGQYEAIYSGMPPHGLGKAASLVPAGARGESAKARLAASGAVGN